MFPEFSVWLSLCLLIFIATSIGFLFSIIHPRGDGLTNKNIIFISFSMLGMALGFLSSNSREPVMSALVPALLTFIGGFTTYLLNKNMDKSILVSKCMICLIFTLFVGICFGVTARESYLIGQEGEGLFLRLQNQAETEHKINIYRTNLDLPPLKPPFKQYLTGSITSSNKND